MLAEAWMEARGHAAHALSYAERTLALNPDNPTVNRVAAKLRRLCDALGG